MEPGVRRNFIWLAVAAIVVLVGGYYENRYFANHARKAKRHAVAQAPALDPLPEPIKAATPEDPGDAKVVGPLAVWMRDADNEEEARESVRAMKPIDRPITSSEPAKAFQTTFELTTSAQCRFVIPPHTLNPTLRGEFQSFTNLNDPDRTSNRKADIGLMLVNADEFDDFLKGQQGDALFAIDSSHHHAVDYALPSTHDQPQEYHLLFQNFPRKTKVFVRAEFTVESE